jgi:hypothetical protein
LRFLDSTKALLLINENLVEMRENNKRVEGKFDKIELKLNQTPLNTELNQTTVVKLIDREEMITDDTLTTKQS